MSRCQGQGCVEGLMTWLLKGDGAMCLCCRQTVSYGLDASVSRKAPVELPKTKKGQNGV